MIPVKSAATNPYQIESFAPRLAFCLEIPGWILDSRSDTSNTESLCDPCSRLRLSAF